MVEKPYKWGEGATLEDHSKRKHKILGEYFRRYIQERCKNPNSRRFRLAVVDGFAGGGRYKDGSPGSPVIFAETLLNTVTDINIERADSGMPAVEVDCLMILNDIEPDAVRGLSEAIAPFEAASRRNGSHVFLQTDIQSEKFGDSVNAFTARIKNEGYRNVIYCLDQCGDRNVERSTITALMGSANSVEVFLTFAIQALITYLNRRDPEAVRRRLGHLDLNPGALAFTDNLLGKTFASR